MTDIPEGWEATEYTRADGAWVRKGHDTWSAGLEEGMFLYDEAEDGPREFPTLAAAIAAVEEV